ncbi:hypothetical protein AMAG_12954 [Allomyces macrogynus ATCC 38327]|uniref:Uncharacterized protein n=1 Tax=Allomyces macrogynus (strain ATCC 38327) TaxID=578462 RepID=A0A0L0T0K7_ALLM3|nr:hypothetical protein AMAG_12954 [Allomyces macrogynus ATCC 38327]|eukprot:KNE68287.1 hypothetical protein AMAG_12954 [Allomyces macrogynus ATCC 38327]
MDRYHHDPGMRRRAIASGDPVRYLIFGPDAKHGNCTAALISIAKAVTQAVLGVLAKDFQLHVGWGDYMDLICCVVLPVIDFFLRG